MRRSVRRFSSANRARRWDVLHRHVDWPAVTRVLDLGGKPGFWLEPGVPDQPLAITLVNINGEPGTQTVGSRTVELMRGDATDPPVDPTAYDLVCSNSVIEHVGGPASIQAFADVTRKGRQYFLQTPNRYFLMEPHFVLPFHFLLPRVVKGAIVMFWDRGPRRRSWAEALERVDSIHLLDRKEVEELFPGDLVVPERRWFHTKSFMVFGAR